MGPQGATGPSGTGGGGGYTTVPVSSSPYNAAQTSGTIVLVCDTSSTGITVNLPTAAGNTATFVVKKTSASNTVTVDGFASELLDGYATTTLTGLYESKTIVNDNANWWVI
jgi:hypothetical protein